MKTYKQCSSAQKSTLPVGQKQGSLIDDVKSIISQEMQTFQSTVLNKFEKSFVSAVESVTADSRKITDELSGIVSQLGETDSAVQSLKRAYDQSASKSNVTVMEESLLTAASSSSEHCVKLTKENKLLQEQIKSLKHEALLSEENLKFKYKTEVESLNSSVRDKDIHLKQLQDEINYKSTLIDKLFEEKAALTERLESNDKTLNNIKGKLHSLKLNFAGNSDKNNNMNLESSDWSTVPGRASKQ